MNIRRAKERGSTKLDWLNSRHSFSFANYYDPDHIGYHLLRVINDDIVQPGKGFDTHSHRDMEIISYVLEGALEHQDSEGNRHIIRPGDIQRMTAGKGITHSEYNHSKDEQVHFLQIWVYPNQKGLAPGYEQKSFAQNSPSAGFIQVVSEDGQQGGISIHQDFNMLVGQLNKSGQTLTFELKPNRALWVQVAKGQVKLSDDSLQAGDGVSIEKAGTLEFYGGDSAEIILMEMPQT